MNVNRIIGAFGTCARKVIAPGKARQLTKAFKELNIPTAFSRDISQISDNSVRNYFTDYALGIVRKPSNQTLDELWRMQEIIQKLNMSADKRIKTEAECILLSADTKSEKSIKRAFDEAEQILDCANTMDGNYSSLYRNASIGREYNSDMPDLILKGNKQEIEDFQNYAFSDARRLSRPIAVKDKLALKGQPKVINANIDEKTLEYIAKNQDIKEYISTAAKGDTVAHTLYCKYLETQPKEIRNKLEDIYHHYGIHTFVDEGAGIDTLSKLKRLEYELKQQLTTSEGKAEFPNLLDLTKYDAHFISNKAGGYTYRGGQFHSKIAINDACDEGIAGLYRHESIHFHDKRVDSKKPKFSNASKEDFFSGSLNIDNISQALLSRTEKIAHSAKLDMSKVHQETKEELIKDGLEPFYTKIQSIKDGNREFLLAEHPIIKKDLVSLIQHSEQGASEELVIDYLRNEGNLDFTTMRYFFEKNPKYKFSNIEELIRHTAEYNENFMKQIQAYFDTTAAQKIIDNPYINKNELLNYIARHTEDREILNEIINTKSISKISDIDFHLECEKLHRTLQEQISILQNLA